MLNDTQIETLRGIVDSNEELRTLVRGNINNPADDVAAAILATSLMPKQVVEGSLYTELGIIAAFSNPADAEVVLQTLEAASLTNPLLARMLRWLAPGMPGLDFGNPALRAALNAYQAAGVLNSTQTNVLLALGEQVLTVNPSDIPKVR